MSNLPFGKKNFLFLFISIFVLILGYTIMSIDSQTFGFGFLGLTLGPVLVLSAFIIGLFAVLKK